MTSLARIKSRLIAYKGIDEFVDRQDLRSMNAYGSSWTNSQFDGCQMNVCNFQSAVLERVTFTKCTAILGNWTLARLKNVVFDSCDLEQAQFTGAAFDEVTFKNCRLSYSNFEKGIGTGLLFEGSNLHGADLRFHTAPSVEYRDSNLWGVQAVMGCQFFGSKFDERSLRMFTGMVARLFPDGPDRTRLVVVAGDSFKVVDRLMREDK